MNKAEIKVLLDEMLANDEASPMLETFLSLGQKSLENKVKIREMEQIVTGTLFEGSQTLRLPGDFIEWRHLVLIDGTTRYTYDRAADTGETILSESTDTGIPALAAHFGDLMYFDVYTDRDFIYELWYFRRLPDFGSKSPPNPTNATHTSASGTLVAGTYYYRVAAFNGWGTTVPSTETSIVLGSTGGVNVNWTPVAGAGGYRVYGRSTGAELLMATVYGEDASTWLDDGSVTPAGAMPATNSAASADNSTNAWSKHYEEMLLLAALKASGKYLPDDGRIKQWTAEYEEALADLIVTTSRQLPHRSVCLERGGSPIARSIVTIQE